MSTETPTRPAWLEPLHLHHVVVGQRHHPDTPPIPGLIDMIGSFWTEADLIAALTDWAADAEATFRPIFADAEEQAHHYAALLTSQMAREAWHILIAGATVPPGHRWATFPHRLVAYPDPDAAPPPDGPAITAERAPGLALVVCWTCGDRLHRPRPRHGGDCYVCTAEWVTSCLHFAARHRNA